MWREESSSPYQASGSFLELGQLIGVEPRGWFVHDENVGFMEQRLCHANSLSISFGQLSNRLIDDAREVAKFDHFSNAVRFLPGRHPRALAKNSNNE